MSDNTALDLALPSPLGNSFPEPRVNSPHLLGIYYVPGIVSGTFMNLSPF